MASAQKQIYMITGANRGLGKTLVTKLLQRSDVTVIAAVRELSTTSAKALSTIPKAPNSRLITIKIDSTSLTDALVAVQNLQLEHGITQLDVVVANAGIGTTYGLLMDATASQIQDHVNVNAIGPFLLFQAVCSLLKKSPRPRFVLVSSPFGSIGGVAKYQTAMFAYGASKSIANYILCKIHVEHEDVIAFAADPGHMKSDMGNTGARHFGAKEASVEVEDSANFVVAQIDEATREKTSGNWPSINRGHVEW